MRDVTACLAVVLVGFGAAFAGAQCNAPLPPLGTVVVLPQACPQGPGPFPGSTCQLLQVQCAGLLPINVQIRILPPNPAVAERGTVVFGSGGGGAAFYPEGNLLFPLLTGMGFRVVDRAWASPGWISAEAGLRIEACRYATLVTWIRNNVHVTGAFCISGNSGGSAEVGYALGTWNLGTIVDLAVPSSGPPVTRLDYDCAVPPPSEWPALCAGIIPPGFMTCTPGCSLVPSNGVCLQCSSSPTAADLLNDSVMHPAVLLAYPTTKVHFLYGVQDCGVSVPQGLNWSQAVTTEKVIEFVPGTPHQIPSTAAGREAIRRAIDNGTPGGAGTAARLIQYGTGCGGTLGAPVIQAYGTPWLGNPQFVIALQGAPSGAAAVLFVSSGQGAVSLGSGCTAWLDLSPGALILPNPGMPASVVTDTLGRGYLTFALPSDPSLLGVSGFAQWGVVDATAPLGVGVTRGLQLILGTQ